MGISNPRAVCGLLRALPSLRSLDVGIVEAEERRPGTVVSREIASKSQGAVYHTTYDTYKY